MADELVSAATSTAFADALKALAPALQADAERYRPEDQEDAAGWRLAMGACARVQAALAGGFWTVGIGSANVERAHLVTSGLGALTVKEVLARMK